MSDDAFGMFEGETRHDSPDDYDRLFDVLSSHRRRVVLRYLADVELASVEEIANVIAARGIDDPLDAALALRHGDLPRLQDARLLEYDPRSGTVRYDGDPFVEELLSRTMVDGRGT